jgi:hypothetical protein
MKTRAIPRLGFGLFGAVLGVCVWFALVLGSGVRACVIDHPQYPQLLLGDTLFTFFGGLASSYIPWIIIVVGFAIGYLIRGKALVILGALLSVAAFWIAYVITAGAICAVLGI